MGFGGMPVVTKNIILINVIMFVATMLAESRGVYLVRYFGLHYYLADDFKPHQFITYIFMHGGIRHILFNMLGVFVFGRQLEMFWGAKRFLIFYIVTGLGAALAQYIVMHLQISDVLNQVNDLIASPDMSTEKRSELINLKYDYLNAPRNIVVGASGSLFGLIGAFAMLFPNQQMYLYIIPIKAKWLAIGYGAMELFSGWQNNPKDNVAHLAHIGGLAVGIILVLIWRRDRSHFY